MCWTDMEYNDVILQVSTYLAMTNKVSTNLIFAMSLTSFETQLELGGQKQRSCWVFVWVKFVVKKTAWAVCEL